MSDDSADLDSDLQNEGFPVTFPDIPVSKSVRQFESRPFFQWPQRPPVEGLIGDRGARRYWAGSVDLLLSAFLSMLLLIALPDFDPVLKGVSFYVAFLLYFQVFEYCFGATPGKWWFQLRVKTFDGARPSFLQIAIRTVLRIVEINPILMGIFPAAIIVAMTRRHVRLGDIMAGTVVVHVEDLQ